MDDVWGHGLHPRSSNCASIVEQNLSLTRNGKHSRGTRHTWHRNGRSQHFLAPLVENDRKSHTFLWLISPSAAGRRWMYYASGRKTTTITRATIAELSMVYPVRPTSNSAASTVMLSTPPTCNPLAGRSMPVQGPKRSLNAIIWESTLTSSTWSLRYSSIHPI